MTITERSEFYVCVGVLHFSNVSATVIHYVREDEFYMSTANQIISSTNFQLQWSKST